MDFWRGVLRQAWLDTWRRVGLNVQTGAVGLCVLGALTVRLRIAGRPVAADDAAQLLFYSFLPAIGGFLIGLAYNALAIPARLHAATIQERDTARRELEAHRNASPQLVLTRAFVREKAILRGRELLGRPFFAQVEFLNDPVTSASTAAATDVQAEVSFFDHNHLAILQGVPGRWENTDPPRSDFDPPVAINIGIGQRRVLDLAMKHPGGQFYAFSNESYQDQRWQYGPYALGAIRSVWFIHVRLRGPRLDQTFQLILRDEPERPRLTTLED